MKDCAESCGQQGAPMEAGGLGQRQSHAAYKQEWLFLGKGEDTVVGLLAVVRAHDAVGLATRQVDCVADVVVYGHVLLQAGQAIGLRLPNTDEQASRTLWTVSMFRVGCARWRWVVQLRVMFLSARA